MRIMQDSLNLASFELLVRIGYSLGEEVAMFTLPAGFREEHETDAAVRMARSEDLADILALDRRLFGSDRRRDFEFLRRFGKILTLHSGRALEGYLAQMPTPGRTMLGPGGAEFRRRRSDGSFFTPWGRRSESSPCCCRREDRRP